MKTILLTTLLLFIAVCASAGADKICIDDFQARRTGDFPEGWQTASFVFARKKTEYYIAGEGGNRFFAARSIGAASSIYKEVSIDSKEYSLLTWKWKVGGVIEKGNEYTKSGDDYAARVYVMFEYRPERTTSYEALERRFIRTVYGKDLPGEALVYVWGNKVPRGRAFPNSDTSKAMMIAVESGPEKAGKWLTESRNVYEDYRKYFSGEPPKISHIAIMTDTDDTGEAAEAFYDDISFVRGAESSIR